MSIKVGMGKIFAKRYQQYPESDRLKIANFIASLFSSGYSNLEGRNKYSDDINPNDSDFLRKITFVKNHCLWHYHIGITSYDMTKKYGDRTSEFVLHYSRINANEIKIADLDRHPPFNLPDIKFLN